MRGSRRGEDIPSKMGNELIFEIFVKEDLFNFNLKKDNIIRLSQGGPCEERVTNI